MSHEHASVGQFRVCVWGTKAASFSFNLGFHTPLHLPMIKDNPRLETMEKDVEGKQWSNGKKGTGKRLFEMSYPWTKVVVAIDLVERAGVALAAVVGDVVAPPFEFGLGPL